MNTTFRRIALGRFHLNLLQISSRNLDPVNKGARETVIVLGYSHLGY